MAIPHATISFSKNQKFILWKNSIFENIGQIGQAQPNASQGISILLEYLQLGSHSIDIYEGPALVYNHVWPNGEKKLVVQMCGEIIGEDPFWLKKFPFVELSNNQSSYSLTKEVLSAYMPFTKHTGDTLFCSHNLHFGHFVADNLPYLVTLSGLFENSSPISHFNSLPLSILRELNQIGFTSNVFSRELTLNSPAGIISSSKLHHGYATDHLVKGFILQKLLHNSMYYPLNPITNASSPYVFLVRSSNYGSRISNFIEISNELKKLEFRAIELDSMTLLDCKNKLASAKLVVAESGTTSLIAAICMKASATLISLQPDILMASPSSEMIVSGLPYVLCYHKSIKVFTGNAIDNHAIQSSRIAYYNPAALVKLVNTLI